MGRPYVVVPVCGRGEAPWKEALPAIHKAWGEPEIWRDLALAGARVTPVYYLNAVDLELDAMGRVTRQPETRRVYQALFIKTILVSFSITALCLVTGYPVAWFIAHAPPRRARVRSA